VIGPILPVAQGLALSPAPAIALGLLVGGLAGVVHFTQLRHTVHLLSRGRTGLALALQLLRIALSAALLAALVACGLVALAAGFAGFLSARTWALKRKRRP